MICDVIGFLFLATLDGGLGYIMAVPEKSYRRLLMLQNVLVSHGSHIAGLNPKAFRQVFPIITFEHVSCYI